MELRGIRGVALLSAKLILAAGLAVVAVALIVADLRTEWNCGGPNPNSWFSVAGSSLIACAVFIALTPPALGSHKRRWWYAVAGAAGVGLLVFVPVAIYELYDSIGVCAN